MKIAELRKLSEADLEVELDRVRVEFANAVGSLKAAEQRVIEANKDIKRLNAEIAKIFKVKQPRIDARLRREHEEAWANGAAP